MRTRYSFLAGVAFVSFAAHGQLLLTDSVLPIDLAQSLAGTGVQVSNAELNGTSGFSPQAGLFDGSACNIGLADGVILATGSIHLAYGPNDDGYMSMNVVETYSDADLWEASGAIDVYDYSVLEFDVVPASDSLQIEYVFASEEYPEYVCSQYNDVIGIFISGPGLVGPYLYQGVNAALVPGTSIPVSINSINSGTAYWQLTLVDSFFCTMVDPLWYTHTALYLANGDGNSSPQDTSAFYVQYDGFTTVLTAAATVQAGSTYHVRVGVADLEDHGWDSAIFLKGGGVTSPLQTAIPHVQQGTLQLTQFQDEVMITVSGASTSANTAVLFDATGRVVDSTPINDGSALFPTSPLPIGSYFVCLPGSGIAPVRFMKLP